MEGSLSALDKRMIKEKTEETNYSKCSTCNNCYIHPDNRTIAFCGKIEDYLTESDLSEEAFGEEACEDYE